MIICMCASDSEPRCAGHAGREWRCRGRVPEDGTRPRRHCGRAAAQGREAGKGSAQSGAGAGARLHGSSNRAERHASRAWARIRRALRHDRAEARGCRTGAALPGDLSSHAQWRRHVAWPRLRCRGTGRAAGADPFRGRIAQGRASGALVRDSCGPPGGPAQGAPASCLSRRCQASGGPR